MRPDAERTDRERGERVDDDGGDQDGDRERQHEVADAGAQDLTQEDERPDGEEHERDGAQPGRDAAGGDARAGEECERQDEDDGRERRVLPEGRAAQLAPPLPLSRLPLT